MREFVHKSSAGEESFNAALEHGNLEQLVDRRPLGRVSLQHHGDDIGDSWREMRRQWRVVALNDFLRKLVEGAGIEGRS